MSATTRNGAELLPWAVERRDAALLARMTPAEREAWRRQRIREQFAEEAAERAALGIPASDARAARDDFAHATLRRER